MLNVHHNTTLNSSKMWESMIAMFGNCNSTFDFCYSHMDFVRFFLYCSPCWHYEYVLHCFCIIFGWFVVIMYNIVFSMKLCMFFGMHQRLWCFTFPHTILDLWASAQSDWRPLYQSSQKNNLTAPSWNPESTKK